MPAAETKPNYLDPQVLAKINRLDLRARLVVEGFMSGQHRSPFHGFSVEFASYREYAPGDELRHLDWKVLSRTDRLFVKQYEQETNLAAYLLLDVSESMRYRGANSPLSKFDYAATAAAALAFLITQHSDAVGLALFDDELRKFLPCSASPIQLQNLVREFETAQPARKTALARIFHDLAEKLHKKEMIVLLSDLLVPRDDLFDGLARFRHRKHEVLVLQVLDHDELEFPFEGNTLFRGMEELPQLMAEPRALRKSYREAVQRFCAEVKRRCSAQRVDYRLLNTREPLDAALAGFLAARATLFKKGGGRR